MSHAILCDMTNSDTQQILEMYASGKITTTAIAKQFSLSTKTIQRIAQEGGVLRTRAQSNKLISPLKRRRPIPKRILDHTKAITRELRKGTLDRPGYDLCCKCNIPRFTGSTFEITFRNGNIMDTSPQNLQAICRNCLYRMLY